MAESLSNIVHLRNVALSLQEKLQHLKNSGKLDLLNEPATTVLFIYPVLRALGYNWDEIREGYYSKGWDLVAYDGKRPLLAIDAKACKHLRRSRLPRANEAELARWAWSNCSEVYAVTDGLRWAFGRELSILAEPEPVIDLTGDGGEKQLAQYARHVLTGALAAEEWMAEPFAPSGNWPDLLQRLRRSSRLMEEQLHPAATRPLAYGCNHFNPLIGPFPLGYGCVRSLQVPR